jgi:hypothetical protein
MDLFPSSGEEREVYSVGTTGQLFLAPSSHLRMETTPFSVRMFVVASRILNDERSQHPSAPETNTVY